MSRKLVASGCVVVLLLLGTSSAYLSAQKARTSTYVLSSGPFAMPDDAGYLIGIFTNPSPEPQTITVNVYIYDMRNPRQLADGPWTYTIVENGATRKLWAVPEPLHGGGLYEVVVTTNSPSILPVVQAVPGWVIPAGSWVRLQ